MLCKSGYGELREGENSNNQASDFVADFRLDAKVCSTKQINFAATE